MTTVLLTAFEPYGEWSDNASWLTLVELTKQLPSAPKLITRRYPVDFITFRDKLALDLENEPDYAIHLGQAPGSTRLKLEAVGINVASEPQQSASLHKALIAGGPAAYQTRLPLANWAERLRAAGIPAAVSYHAGTYLCNAALYLSQHLVAERNLKTQSFFIHLPLETSQVANDARDWPSLPASLCAQGLRVILEQMIS